VLRKACGVVIVVAERISKIDSVKTLNGYWHALKQKRSLSWVINDSRDSVTQIADELKSNDLDIIIIIIIIILLLLFIIITQNWENKHETDARHSSI